MYVFFIFSVYIFYIYIYTVYKLTPYIHTYIQYMYGTFGRDITIHTVIYIVHTRFWPTL